MGADVRRVFAAALAALAVALAGCAGPSRPPEPVFAPNPNLLVQGVPPIPQALVDRVAKYTEFRGHRFVEWHPTRREMLVAYRKEGDTIPQLYRLAAPMAPLEQLTFDTEPVFNATYEPREGRYVVFARSVGGNEASQLYRLDLDTRQATLLTDPDLRHAMAGWQRAGARLVYLSVPLDRTAQGGTRTEVQTTVTVVDPLRPQERRTLAVLPGGGWWGNAVDAQGTRLALTRYRSAAESEVWMLDLASGERRRVLPADGETLKATHFAADFTHDGRGLLFTSDRAGEFRELMALDLASGRITRATSHIPWDIGDPRLSDDGRLLVLQANVDGRDELRLFDGAGLKELPVPRLPAGSVGSAEFHPARAEVALSLTSTKGPSQLYSLDPKDGRVEQWTRAYAPPGVDMANFGDQAVVRWTSFDGRTISGLVTRPPARFTGRRPVVIDIHGGPEAQAKFGFMGRDSYLVQELGLVIIEPNVRGSAGFGKSFLALDNGRLREDSVKDIGALLDWIATQPDLDASRVVVTGGSYGGYMSLATAVHYGHRIAGAIDDVGISHFVTFLQNTESYRRDLRRVEYGDERDPAMREFLDRISPLTNAKRITKPLFVIQGRNDPRVPYTEAEQIVAQVRANGTPVWYLRAENEGHGFVRKENADFRFYAVVRFIESVFAGTLK